MTDDQLQAALKEAASAGAKQAIELQAAAFRSAVQSPATTNLTLKSAKPQHYPWVGIITLAVLICGGIFPWVNGISSRVSVVETRLLTDDEKLSSLDKAVADLAALRQEISDFRSDFRDWQNRQKPTH